MPLLANGIAIAAIAVYAIGWLIAGPSWPMGIFGLAANFVVENGVYFSLVLAGWTAWVCFCALIYTAFERLFPDFLAPPGESG
jgi:hypothetical protein